MSTAFDCVRVRELAPELALGIADGEQRAAALAHLSSCGDCRRHLEELSATADELPLLAPAEEPPLGFEERVLRRLQPSARPARRRRRRRWRRIATIATATATAAAAGAAAVWVGLGSDRDLAREYREALGTAGGSYFAAARLETPDGREVGDVFGYRGQPSWVMVIVEPPESYPGAGGGALASGTYRVVLVRDDGRRIALGRLAVTNGLGSLGGAIPPARRRLSELTLLGSGGGAVAKADLDAAE